APRLAQGLEQQRHGTGAEAERYDLRKELGAVALPGDRGKGERKGAEDHCEDEQHSAEHEIAEAHGCDFPAPTRATATADPLPGRQRWLSGIRLAATGPGPRPP